MHHKMVVPYPIGLQMVKAGTSRNLGELCWMSTTVG